MVHIYNGVCGYVFEAAVKIFENCGKAFQNTYKSEPMEREVSIDKMKIWLQQIRQESRSELRACHVVILNFTLIQYFYFRQFIELLTCKINGQFIKFCSRVIHKRNLGFKGFGTE